MAGNPGVARTRTIGSVATIEEFDPAAVAEVGQRLRENVRRAVKVDDGVVRDLLVALFAEGHVLIEDYPGSARRRSRGRSRARSTPITRACSARPTCSRPTSSAPTSSTSARRRFEFHPGPVFANVVLVDEINRSSPKTQSGLLECMQERHVTVDGHQHELARPFVVIATQNPAEYEGTYPLPEAQLDRFMVRVSLGYPTRPTRRRCSSSTPPTTACTTSARSPTSPTVRAAQAAVAAMHGSEALRRYVVALGEATRTDTRVELGASPRAALMLFRAAKALAALDGRDHVLPDDVQALAPPCSPTGSCSRPRPRRATRTVVITDALERVPAL